MSFIRLVHYISILICLSSEVSLGEWYHHLSSQGRILESFLTPFSLALYIRPQALLVFTFLPCLELTYFPCLGLGFDTSAFVLLQLLSSTGLLASALFFFFAKVICHSSASNYHLGGPYCSLDKLAVNQQISFIYWIKPF